MLSKKLISEMTFGELQSHIKNHEQELKQLKEEANRRASLVEG